MLAEPDRLLLTAYVDGELSTRQHRQLLKLLRRSDEARNLLGQLQSHARTLRHLPRTQIPMDLSDSVILLIRQRRMKPRLQPVPAVQRTFSVWASYAAAAAVLFVVCTGSYLFFANVFKQGDVPIVADAGAATQPKHQASQKPVDPVVKDKAVAKNPETIDVMPKVQPRDDAPIVKVPNETDPKPSEAIPNREAPRDPGVVTAPVTDMVELKMVDIAAPVIVKLQEVDQATTKSTLLAEFNKASGFRIEFPCRNGSRGFERFQAVCKNQGIGLQIDKDAVERLKHPAFKTNYAIYLEDVTPDELTQILRQVAVEDAKKPEGKKVVEGQFERIVLVRMSQRDRKELTELLGADPTAAATGPLGTDLHKPLSDQTASQIAAALTGQGGTPRPDGSKTTGKAVERMALAIPYTPFHPEAKSTEIKRYFDTRKTARPGTLQVFLVIRETSG